MATTNRRNGTGRSQRKGKPSLFRPKAWTTSIGLTELGFKILDATGRRLGGASNSDIVEGLLRQYGGQLDLARYQQAREAQS